MFHIRGLEIIRLNNFHWLRAIGNFFKKIDFALDFFVKMDEKTVYIVETKGGEDLDDPLKISRLAQWCEDADNR